MPHKEGGEEANRLTRNRIGKRGCCLYHGPQSPSNEETAKDDAPRFQVDTLVSKGPTWQCDLITDGQRVDYKLDTGAQVNLLPHELYRMLSPRPQLHPTRSRLFAYGADSPIPMKGQYICSVRLPHWACKLVSNWG